MVLKANLVLWGGSVTTSMGGSAGGSAEVPQSSAEALRRGSAERFCRGGFKGKLGSAERFCRRFCGGSAEP